MNYTELSAYILDNVEDASDEITDNLPNLVRQAENRILYELQLPFFQKSSTGTTTSSNRYLTTPTDFLSVYVVQVVNAGSYEALLPKELSFIREAYPAPTTTGVPKYYALFDQNTLLLGPTPDSSYTIELSYFYKPESIVTATTTWLGDNAETLLAHACMVEAYKFIKNFGGDTGGGAKFWEEQYQKSLVETRRYGDGMTERDDYRNRQTRVELT